MEIAQAIRAQMIGQLIDALGSGAAKTAEAALGVALKQGQSLAATVIGETSPGRIALKLQGQTIVADVRDARLPAEARQPGATLQLTVETGGQTPRLSLAGFSPPRAGAPEAARLPAGSLASGVAVSVVAVPEAKSAPSAPGPPSPLQAALKAATATAAAKQGSAAPLYADLAAVVRNPAAPLPEPARQVAALLLANRLDGDAPITPEAVKQALTRAGVSTPAPPAQEGALPIPDTKALLAALKALLPRPAAEPLPQNRQQQDAPPPEPPRRDGAVNAQRPALAALAGEREPAILAGGLARETEQALERAKLLQIASLPEPRATANEASRPQQITVELPIALGQQTAMAGVRVERDGRGGRDASGNPVDVWGIRFAIETDEIGAVHAHLRLAGEQIGVTLWADDPLTHRAFVDAVPRLEAALRDAALEVGEIALFSGKPHEPKRGGPGHFLDVSS